MKKTPLNANEEQPGCLCVWTFGQKDKKRNRAQPKATPPLASEPRASEAGTAQHHTGQTHVDTPSEASQSSQIAHLQLQLQTLQLQIHGFQQLQHAQPLPLPPPGSYPPGPYPRPYIGGPYLPPHATGTYLPPPASSGPYPPPHAAGPYPPFHAAGPYLSPHAPGPYPMPALHEDHVLDADEVDVTNSYNLPSSAMHRGPPPAVRPRRRAHRAPSSLMSYQSESEAMFTAIDCAHSESGSESDSSSASQSDRERGRDQGTATEVDTRTPMSVDWFPAASALSNAHAMSDAQSKGPRRGSYKPFAENGGPGGSSGRLRRGAEDAGGLLTPRTREQIYGGGPSDLLSDSMLGYLGSPPASGQLNSMQAIGMVAEGRFRRGHR